MSSSQPGVVDGGRRLGRVMPTVADLRLVRTLAAREFSARYRDSMLGLLWALIMPLALLGIYAFVFSRIFTARWESPTGEKTQFALLLFSGLLLFNIFSETLNAATSLISSNGSLIKRTQFAPRLLPLSTMLASFFSFGLSLVPFTLLYVVSLGAPPWTIVLLPLVLLPLAVMTAGLAYMIAGLAAYVRDMRNVVQLATTVVLFMSPIFFPEEAIPAGARGLLTWVNPLFVLLPASKDVLFWGRVPDLVPLGVHLAIGLVVLFVGHQLFERLRPGFADVI